MPAVKKMCDKYAQLISSFIDRQALSSVPNNFSM